MFDILYKMAINLMAAILNLLRSHRRRDTHALRTEQAMYRYALCEATTVSLMTSWQTIV